MTLSKLWMAAALTFVTLAAAPRANAQAAAKVVNPCTALTALDLTDLPGASTKIVSATVQPAANGIPSFCKVNGFVAPQVGFELRLPVAGWNGRFLMQGCGFMCGFLNMEACEDALAGNDAVVNTDMGHSGGMGNTSWAHNVFEPKIDFGYRGTHVVAVVSKVILAKYYGHPQNYSYFRGCSTGGRQAMVEAQRFPDDFDGIVAGGSVLDETGDAIYHLIWNGRQTLDTDGHSLIDATKIPMVHQAVLAACDANDGVKDGVLQDPRTCHWDPAAIECTSGSKPSCLTSTEAAIIRSIYTGNRDSKGNFLYPGGMMRGSELEWVPLFIGVDGQLPNYLAVGMTQVVRQVFLPEDPGPGFSLVTADLAQLSERIRVVEPLYDAQNPDLTAFKHHGGKLIMYHGWEDAEIPPNVSIDYYEKATRVLGGPANTLDFYRLFMVPGMAHCRRGPGADVIDYLGAIEAWVERGQAPGSLLASHPKTPQAYNGLPPLRFPLAPGSIAWTRPIFAYPNVATWTGRGDANDAANYTAAPTPRSLPQ